jgi:RimJ/RimL family protein N-acetyltransferase
MLIRPLCVDDAEAYLVLRQQALRDEPMAFLSSPEDDIARTVDAVRVQLRRPAHEAVVFGAFAAALIGIVGLHRDHHRKAAHKVHLWGMYVVPGHRRQGVAASLLAAALAHARALPGVAWAHLSVSATAPGARRVYERAGFRLWGSEPDALRHDGETAVEHHLAARLD